MRAEDITDRKFKCLCGCNRVLYISIEKDIDDIIIGSEDSDKVSFEEFKGVVISRNELLKLLRDA